MIRMRVFFTLFIFMLLSLIFSFSENLSGRIISLLLIIFLFIYIFYKKFFHKKRFIIRKKYLLFLILILITIAFSMLRGFSVSSREKAIVERVDETNDFTIEGEVEKKERKGDSYKIYLKDAKIADYDERLFNIGKAIIFLDSDDLYIGSKVKLSGKKIAIHSTENEGGFDERKYLASQGIYLKLKNVRLDSQLEPKLMLFEYLYRLRKSMSLFFRNNLPSEEGDIVSAMVLGEKESLDTETKELFSGAGLAYILVVSGQHISIVGFFLEKLLRKCGLSFKCTFFIVIPVVFLYSVMAGFSVSQQRAFLMFFMLCAAKVLGENYDAVTSISIAGIIIFLISPKAIFDAGAVFSFSAVFIISLVVVPSDRAYVKLVYSRHKTEHGYSLNIVECLTRSILSSTLIFLGTCPIVSFYYYELPVFQIFLSIILLPFTGPVIVMSLLAGIFRFALMLKPVHIIIYFYELCCDKVLSLPFSKVITGKPSFLQIVIYYSVYAVLSFLVLRFLQKSVSFDERFISKKRRELFSKEKKKELFKIFATISIVLVIIFFPKKRDFEITFLSVGQGLSIYLEGRDGSSFCIDGGSSSNDSVGRYVILPFLKSRGIRKIDAWFVTHTDSDHMNGLLYVLQNGYRVKRLVFDEGVVKDENYSLLIDAAEKNNTEILYMKCGDFIHTKSFDLSCIFSKSEMKPDDTNANSMGLILQANEKGYEDFSFLFTGDMGEDEEKEIVENIEIEDTISDSEQTSSENKDTNQFLSLKNVTGYQAAHHGSKYSNSEVFLDTISPRFTVISAGENNMYGHPHKETLERFKDRDITYYCTIECGQITILPERGYDEMISTYTNE